MEKIKLDQSQLEYLVIELSKMSTADKTQLVVGGITTLVLIITLWLQRKTYINSKEVAVLERKAKRAQYMPKMDIQFEGVEDQVMNFVLLEANNPDNNFGFSIRIQVNENAIANVRYVLDSNIPEFSRVEKTLNKDAFWAAGDVLERREFLHLPISPQNFNNPENANLFVTFTLFFEDLVGNAYVRKTRYGFTEGGFSIDDPLITLN